MEEGDVDEEGRGVVSVRPMSRVRGMSSSSRRGVVRGMRLRLGRMARDGVLEGWRCRDRRMR